MSPRRVPSDFAPRAYQPGGEGTCQSKSESHRHGRASASRPGPPGNRASGGLDWSVQLTPRQRPVADRRKDPRQGTETLQRCGNAGMIGQSARSLFPWLR